MKLSPVTVPYRAAQRSASVLVAAAVAAGSEAAALVGGRAGVAGLAAAAVAAVLAYEVAYYRRFEYELTDDTLDIRSGVVGRRERELPYRRVQNVDVSRGAVQRLLGIAAVGFETAGGDGTEGSIRYVSAAEARRLQREIQRRKRGAGRTGGEGTGGGEAGEGEADEEELFAISTRELALAGALSFDARVVGALTLLGPGSVPFLRGAVAEATPATAALAAAGLLAAAWLLGAAVAVVNYHGFRLTRAGEEFRYERGLLGRYSGSVPRSKVQTVAVGDNPLKRAFGYATLTVETAGYGPGEGGGSQVAVPIARRERVAALAREIEPFGDPAFERPPRRVRRRYAVRYLLALAALVAAAFAVDRRLALELPWYAPGALAVLVPAAAHLKWRHRGYWTGADHVLTRNGFWRRSTRVVPYYRIQTVVDSRTPFQRRWGVATVTVDTAGTSSLLGRDAAAVDVAVPAARELAGTLTDRLQASLAGRGGPGGGSPPGD